MFFHNIFTPQPEPEFSLTFKYPGEFKNINKCKFGDSKIKIFEEVEEEGRFVDNDGMPEICIQCSKE